MTTYTYRKISYLNDPYQQYLLSKGKSEIKTNNNQFLSPNTIKKDHRTTKLLLDVNEYGVFSNLENTNSKNNSLLTPRSPKLNKNTSIPNVDPKNGFLAPPSTNNGLLASPNSNKENEKLTPTITKTTKAQKHSSFINPLINMKFDVGGIFDNDKDGSNLFSSILSKFDNIESDNKAASNEENKNTENNAESETGTEENNRTVEDIKMENRLSQDTIRLKHSSTIKRNCSIMTNTTIKTDRHASQDTITLLKENAKKVGSFDNQLVENLNDQPAIVVDETYLDNNNLDNDDYNDNYYVDNDDNYYMGNNVDSEEENTGFDPDIYKDDDKFDLSYSHNWVDQYRDNNKNHQSSIKSAQSKLSAFSSFTIKSTKKLGRKAKKFYKKITKQKQTPEFPISPIDIPDSYNEKERAFEEMIFRDDTISLSLSNATLTSTFADKNFPLGDNIDENSNTDGTAYADCSFVSSISCYEGEGLSSKKKRHRKGINFEEALKEGNEFRKSLANL